MADIPTEVRFDMEAVRSAFMRAGDELKSDIVREFQATAQEVESRAISAYPRSRVKNKKLGVRLKEGVRLVMQEDGAKVRSTAYHAHLYEYGTEQRDYKGADRGKMPIGSLFIPIAARARALSLARIQSMLDAPREIG